MEEIIVRDIENYNIKFINGDLIITSKNNYIDETDLKFIDLTKSIIIDCRICYKNNNLITNKTNYMNILIEIWKLYNIAEIIQKTNFNISLKNENNYNGYIWNELLGFSYIRENENKILKEIINFIKFNDYIIDIKIKLNNNKIIFFKI
jgi:hypothetical protein